MLGTSEEVRRLLEQRVQTSQRAQYTNEQSRIMQRGRVASPCA